MRARDAFNTPEISPDVAGWRRERMPEMLVDEPILVVPDWVCDRDVQRPDRGADRAVRRGAAERRRLVAAGAVR
jgi:hypothetical protein